LVSKSKEIKVFNIGGESQSSSLFLNSDYQACIGSGGNWSKEFNKNNEFEYGDNSIVNIEVNCEEKTIYFFISKSQCPYYISNICSSSFPLLFCFSSPYSPIIEVNSLFKILPSSSYINPSVKC
jgi:hypothetical protein